MNAERGFTSVEELFQATRSSALLGEKRDSISDSEKLLARLNIYPRVEYRQSSIPSHPTAVVANHFCRSLLDRRFSFPGIIFTTLESMITASITSIGARDLNGKRITWFVQSDPTDKFLSFVLEDKVTQKAMIECYDSIPVSSKNPSVSGYRKAVSALRAGRNVGIFPEGKPNRKLQEYHRGFEGLITILKQKVPDFQILPVIISYSEGKYLTVFGEVISPEGDSGDIARETMNRISENLPPNLRKNY